MKKFVLALTVFIAINYTISSQTIQDVINEASRGIQIVYVSYDLQDDKNIVVWKRVHKDTISKYAEDYADSAKINYFVVYRSEPSEDNYVALDTIPGDAEPIFVDQSSQPDKQQYKYKLQANISAWIKGFGVEQTFDTDIDSCRYHKTLFFSKVSTGDSIQFIVKPYEIENFDITRFLSRLTINIYRSSSAGTILEGVNLYDSVTYNLGDTLLTFIEDDPEALDTNNMFYYMGAVELADTIYPMEYADFSILKASSGPFSQALSNLEDNRLKESSGVVESSEKAVSGFSVYPNPLTEQSVVEYNIDKKTHVTLKVFSVDGSEITTIINESQSAGSYQYDIYPLLNGESLSMAVVKLMVDGKSKAQKVIISQ